MTITPARVAFATIAGGLVVGTGAALLTLAAARLAVRPEPAPRDPGRLGLPSCPVEAQDLLVDAALQCWFDDPAGPWRILSRLWAGDSLLIEVQAASLASARRIARHAVACCSDQVGEILVYVSERPAAGQPRRVVRIRWTRRRGFEEMAYEIGRTAADPRRPGRRFHGRPTGSSLGSTPGPD
jgi:hypothetical protein